MATPSGPKQQNKRNWVMYLSYLGDWLLTVVLLAIFIGIDQLDGFKRRFSLDDESIQFPYTLHERVPNRLLAVICLVIPFCIMPIVNLITVRSFWDFHNSEIGLLLSLVLAGAMTNIFKLTVGRPRPDAIDRCRPEPGFTNPPVFGLVDSSICTQTNSAVMRDGWKSFASGHSSLSFAGLGFLSLYLAGKVHLFDKRGYTTKAWVSVIPVFGATIVAITRTMDYRHHWQDVFVGGIIGASAAYFSYRQYFPSLGSKYSHLPFGPRSSILSSSIDPDEETGMALSERHGRKKFRKGAKGTENETGGDGEPVVENTPDVEGPVPRKGPNLEAAA